MLRATLLTIVLTFGAGPTVGLFCQALCDPHVAAASGCHYDGHLGVTMLEGGTSCQEQSIRSVALAKETARAPSSAADAVLASPYYLMAPVAGAPAVSDDGRRAHQNRPLSTPLRR